METKNYAGFKLLGQIGEGSFGKVYKAFDNETKTEVALKILSKRSRQLSDLKTLKEEARIHQDLSHPNIIRLIRTFETPKELVFVCEFAVSDLHKLLARKGSLGELRTQKVSYDLISALYYLHSHRIIHRDLKPPNILLDKDCKAKICDFGLARSVNLESMMLESLKGTPLYMSPELLMSQGYSHETDLWSLGCIIYEMLAGETPFYTNRITTLPLLIQQGFIKWPTFLSGTCISFLKGLLVSNPQNRMSWDEIIEHKFVKGNILILKDDKKSDDPFTKPRAYFSDQPKIEKAQHSVSIARISKLKKAIGGMGEDINVMSSCNSVKVNWNLQSDIEETDNEELLLLKNDCDDWETSGDVGDKCDMDEVFEEARRRSLPINSQVPQFSNPQGFQIAPMRGHNIGNFQPLAENPNMVMHFLMDNVDPELQNFIMSPQMIPPMFPPVQAHPVQKLTQDLEDFSLRMEKSVDVPNASLKKSEKTHSDEMSTDVSSVPVETEEWLQFLLKAMQEILEGDLEIYKQDNMMKMIVGLLRDEKLTSKLIDHVVQLLCLPYAIDVPQSIVEDIDKLYLQMKIVPNLVYASHLLCRKKFSHQIVQFTANELKTLSGIYDLVVYFAHSGEAFLHAFCDAIDIIIMDNLFRSFILSGIDGESKDGVRLTGSIIALIGVLLQDLPENAKLIEKIIFHEDIDLSKLLCHPVSEIRLRTCLMLRLLGRFCCFSLQNNWKPEVGSALEELKTDSDETVRAEALNVIEEFRDCVSWFKIGNL